VWGRGLFVTKILLAGFGLPLAEEKNVLPADHITVFGAACGRYSLVDCATGALEPGIRVIYLAGTGLDICTVYDADVCLAGNRAGRRRGL
jgi:hypothetical protein